ncbi:hypothetical protein BS47DRAFT_1486086 [Hydnum rufescens UP504]|uniref:Zinc finger ZPR1-type domain-containing protein n=1 Tax=Hydnum rufescens UP504 TaxID=1448309 RepID=A0A9P6DWD8_9AGAM|nr:hypothetical protein BS47DRAFT_1486086 [Hydnum rufescens UP504]
MSCGEQGRTRMLLTSIPYFKEVIIMSFRCEHCGASNNEIQSAGAYRDYGTVYTVKVFDREDLDRQLVKANTCTVTIPEFELTIPAGRGQLTTIEGLFRDVIQDLSADQPLRRIQDEVTYGKIQSLVDGLSEIIADSDSDESDPPNITRERKKKERLEKPIRSFTVILDDPTGNSFIEFRDSMADPKWSMRQYNRTREQNAELGLASADVPPDSATVLPHKIVLTAESKEEASEAALNANEDIFVFPGVCASCGHALDTMMKKVVIPYFKDIIIMSTNCAVCGYRDNEVKSGGEIARQGKKITLRVEDAEDLGRDILKSETCGLSIPEIDLVLQPGTLGGRFTTLEGILIQVYEELNEKVFMGDSVKTPHITLKQAAADEEEARNETVNYRNKFSEFLGHLKAIMAAERPFTLILDDPLANSYLQNLYAPDEDPNMTVEIYDRTFEQNEDLGLNDMKLEGYGEDPTETEKMQARGISHA